MKTFKLFATLFTAVAMLFAEGCQPEPTDKPNQPDEKPCFTFEILETNKTTVSFRVTPLAQEMPYVVMITDKATFETFESIDAYIADDLAWFDQVAMDMGITLEDYLGTFLTTGIKEDIAEGLKLLVLEVRNHLARGSKMVSI